MNTQKSISKRYDALEKEMERVRKEINDERRITHTAIIGYVAAHKMGINEGVILNNAFGIRSEIAQDEMMNLCSTILKPLEKDLFVLRDKIGGIRESAGAFEPLLMDFLRERATIYSSKDNGKRAEIFANVFQEIIEKENLADKKSIKISLVYPQVIAIVTQWHRYDSKFANALINAVRLKESDPQLRLAIDRMALVDPRYKPIKA